MLHIFQPVEISKIVDFSLLVFFGGGLLLLLLFFFRFKYSHSNVFCRLIQAVRPKEDRNSETKSFKDSSTSSTSLKRESLKQAVLPKEDRDSGTRSLNDSPSTNSTPLKQSESNDDENETNEVKPDESDVLSKQKMDFSSTCGIKEICASGKKPDMDNSNAIAGEGSHISMQSQYFGEQTNKGMFGETAQRNLPHLDDHAEAGPNTSTVLSLQDATIESAVNSEDASEVDDKVCQQHTHVSVDKTCLSVPENRPCKLNYKIMFACLSALTQNEISGDHKCSGNSMNFELD